MNLIIVEINLKSNIEYSLRHNIEKYRTDCAAKRRVRWLRTLISADRTRAISELEAPDAESVRELLRQQRISFDRVWTAREKRNYG